MLPIGLVWWTFHSKPVWYESECLFYVEVRGNEKDIWYVGQLVLANVSVEGLIIDFMNIASLMVLTRIYDSLLNMGKLSQFSMMTWDVGMVINGGRCTKIFFYLSPKVLAYSLIYSSSHSNLLHLYLYITPLFCVILSLSLVTTRRLLMVLSPITWAWMPTSHKCWNFCWDPWHKVPPCGCCSGCCWCYCPWNHCGLVCYSIYGCSRFEACLGPMWGIASD